MHRAHGVGERGRSEELARDPHASLVSKHHEPHITQGSSTQVIMYVTLNTIIARLLTSVGSFHLRYFLGPDANLKSH